jgi:soluble P-type ATPase
VRWCSGNRHALLNAGVSVAVADREAQRAEAMGRTVVFLAVGGRVRALFVLEDPVRAEARAAVQTLIDLGVEVVLLAGDHRTTVESLARPLDITHIKAELTSEERAHEVTRLRDAGVGVAVVGRAPDDELALATSDVALTLDAAGGVHEGDIAVGSDDLRDAADALVLASARAATCGRARASWARACRWPAPARCAWSTGAATWRCAGDRRLGVAKPCAPVTKRSAPSAPPARARPDAPAVERCARRVLNARRETSRSERCRTKPGEDVSRGARRAGGALQRQRGRRQAPRPRTSAARSLTPRMLAPRGILSADDAAASSRASTRMRDEVEAGQLPGASARGRAHEHRGVLTERIGEAGGVLHTGAAATIRSPPTCGCGRARPATRPCAASTI